jgi:hypothetical protein
MDRASELDRTFNAEKERFTDDREDAVQKINELLDKRAELGAVVAKSKAKAKYYRGQVSCRSHNHHEHECTHMALSTWPRIVCRLVLQGL